MGARKNIDLLTARAEANLHDPLRNGQVIHLPAKGELIIVGDLHNHQRNFERVIKFAALDQFPNRYVILQEIIHGGPLGPRGEDSSFDMLLAALHWAARFPGRVQFLLANHDLAQVQKIAIMKDGYDLTDRFNRNFDLRFGAEAEHVAAAFRHYVFSQALAAITVTGIFLAHSLPSPRDAADFDTSILRRPLTDADYIRNGSVYKLIWGRNQTADVLAQMSRAWWADVFVCGHQQQDMGYGVIPPNMLILDSSHNHGTLLHVDLARPYTLDDLVARLLPLASLT